jgi:hypothetical protein
VIGNGVSAIDILSSLNRCQIEQMEKAQPDVTSGTEFVKQVRNVQASIISAYQVCAFSAVREVDPAQAASMWKQVSSLCENALRALRHLKVAFPACGTSELYDLTLDYKSEADKRYYQNLQDAECARTKIPEGLFPTQS